MFWRQMTVPNDNDAMGREREGERENDNDVIWCGDIW